jgi:adenylosuccinate synthase
MKNLAVIGAQWGDEGKGKIVDLVSLHYDIVARYQGGHNAGHTVMIQGKSYILQLIPSGMLRGGKIGVIGNGVVVEPTALISEIGKMEAAGFSFNRRLYISDRSHVIMPHHLWREEESEKKLQIGTTMRGIGPCYEDKAGRRGVRILDFIQPDFTERWREIYGKDDRAKEFLSRSSAMGKQISQYVCNCSAFLSQALRDNKALLFEGAQGTMLDVDHGTYPYVTSSNCAAGGISVGLGIGPKYVQKVLGVSKAYVTRVGGGPLPTELLDETGEYIRKKGKEFGAVTGRPRRCGWLDLVQLKYASEVNGMDLLCITKLDILDELDEIRVCTKYEADGKEVREFPASNDLLSRCRPVLKTFTGWKSNTFALRKLADLPTRARDYLAFIEDYLEVPIAMISTSPERDDTIFYPAFDSLLQ